MAALKRQLWLRCGLVSKAQHHGSGSIQGDRFELHRTPAYAAISRFVVSRTCYPQVTLVSEASLAYCDFNRPEKRKNRGIPRLRRTWKLERAKGFEPSTPTLARLEPSFPAVSCVYPLPSDFIAISAITGYRVSYAFHFGGDTVATWRRGNLPRRLSTALAPTDRAFIVYDSELKGLWPAGRAVWGEDVAGRVPALSWRPGGGEEAHGARRVQHAHPRSSQAEGPRHPRRSLEGRRSGARSEREAPGDEGRRPRSTCTSRKAATCCEASGRASR